ncbi:MAG: class I SAM-dependent methyltransferase [Burkholderiales bacterium]|nr:class I SAM-dependent methyltransferase [Opitutaceae bacterium]
MSEQRYTDGAYLQRHPTWHREHSDWKAMQVQRLLARHALVPRTVVEVGCGAGGILAALQRHLDRSVEFTGYEIAPDAIRLAQPLANERLRFVQGDFVASASSPVDVLLAIDVVEHVSDYLGLLHALRRRARAHVFHLPLDLSLLSSLRPERLRWAYESVGHLHYFTAETALRALRNAGYNVTDWTFTAVELDLPPPPGQRQRLRALRRLGRRISPGWTSRVLGGFSLLALCTEELARP